MLQKNIMLLLLMLFMPSLVCIGCFGSDKSEEELIGEVTYYEENGSKYAKVIQSPYQKSKKPYKKGKNPDIEELFYIKNYGKKANDDPLVGYWVSGLNKKIGDDEYVAATTYEWEADYAFEVVHISKNEKTNQYMLRVFSCEILPTTKELIGYWIDDKKSPLEEANRIQHWNGIQAYRSTIDTLDVTVEKNVIVANIYTMRGEQGTIRLKYNQSQDTMELLEFDYPYHNQYNLDGFQFRDHNDILKRYSTEQDLNELIDAMFQVKLDKIHELYPNYSGYKNLMTEYEHKILVSSSKETSSSLDMFKRPEPPKLPEPPKPPPLPPHFGEVDPSEKEINKIPIALITDITKERLVEDPMIGIWVSDMVGYKEESKEVRPISGMPYDLFTSKTIHFIVIDKREGDYVVTLGHDVIRPISKEMKSYEKQLKEIKTLPYNYESLFNRSRSVSSPSTYVLKIHDDTRYQIGYDKIKRFFVWDITLKYDLNNKKIVITNYEEYLGDKKIEDYRDSTLGKGITEAHFFTRYDRESYSEMREGFWKNMEDEAKRLDRLNKIN